MFAVYRVKVEEYIPGQGWAGDGFLYSPDKVRLEAEVERRLLSCGFNQQRARAGEPEIVKVHPTFLNELKKSSVIATAWDIHPADQGTLQDHKKTFVAAIRQGRNNNPSVVR